MITANYYIIVLISFIPSYENYTTSFRLVKCRYTIGLETKKTIETAVELDTPMRVNQLFALEISVKPSNCNIIYI